MATNKHNESFPTTVVYSKNCLKSDRQSLGGFDKSNQHILQFRANCVDSLSSFLGREGMSGIQITV